MTYIFINWSEEALSGDQTQVSLDQVVSLSPVFDEETVTESVVGHVVQDLEVVSVVDGHTTSKVVVKRILLNDRPIRKEDIVIVT